MKQNIEVIDLDKKEYFELKLMQCGHIGYAQTKDGKPYCLICDCSKVAKDQSKISKVIVGRKAKCMYCDKFENSSYNLPFFQPRPDKDYDLYYCGCGGWD